ncbi:hypothetical protein Tsubulata_050888, partial [Turnera subulata]
YPMSAPQWFLLVLSILIISSPFSSSSSHDTLREGSRLAVTNPDHVLVSANNVFSAGFYPVGDNAYCFAIWFNDPSCPHNCTLVWMANRDTPVNGRRSTLSLLKTGNLVLTDAGKTVVWSTDTSSSSCLSLRLLNSGNLALVTEEGFIMWQSFDSPTDTLLPGQPLTRKTQLVSSRSQSNFSSGFYRLTFDDDNVLRLIYEGPDLSSVMWPDHWLRSFEAGRTEYNSSRNAVFDSYGNFTSSDNLTFYSSDYGAILQRRLTVDFDGNLRMYGRQDWRSSWVVSWEVFAHPCKIHGTCGPNAVCRYIPNIGRTCSCHQGFKRKDLTDWSLGCEPEFNASCAPTESTFHRISRTESYGYDIQFYINYTLDMCKEVCLQRCDCKGFVFKYYFQNYPDYIPYCFPKSQLLNGYRSPNFRGDLYVKVPKTSEFSNDWPANEIKLELDCSTGAVENLDRKYEKSRGNGSTTILLWFVSAVGILELCGIFLVWLFMIRSRQNRVSDFGLSRLLNRGDLDNPSFSRIRGTRGYMAPEWLRKQPITSKVDVYSFGVVVMETITGKNLGLENVDSREEAERRKLLGENREMKYGGVTDALIKDLVDPTMGSDFDINKVKSLLRVALNCVKQDKDSRPTMSQVVEMLLYHKDDDQQPNS